MSSPLASLFAAMATGWTTFASAQAPGLPTPPPVTAVGQQDVILAGARFNRGGLPGRRAATGSMPVTAPSASQPPAIAATPAGNIAAVPSDEQLRAQLDLAIDVSSRRFLTANVHSPWQIFHGLLALKQDFELKVGTEKVNAIRWIATSEPRFDNQPLLVKTPHGGKFHSFTRPYAFEGHPAQFLALLSQSDLPLGFAFKVDSSQITIGDIVNNTMKEVNSQEEVTWVLWALQHYLKTDAQWLNQFNEPWSIERLVQIETSLPVVGAPCGGNHRLFALTRARDKHLRHGGKLVGVWAQADYKVRQHIEVARSLQNYDGSFSAKFYETSGHTTDLNQRFNSSGHTMEFLAIALPAERLQEPWVRSAVMSLSNDLVTNRQRQIDCGPLYHTLNSLMIYRERIRATPTTGPAPLAARPAASGKPGSPAGGLAANPAPGVVSQPGSTTIKPLDTNPVKLQQPTAVDDLPSRVADVKPKTGAAAEPASEALNELKLDDQFRGRLNALTSPSLQPTADASLQPAKQQARDEGSDPISALTPDNSPR